MAQPIAGMVLRIIDDSKILRIIFQFDEFRCPSSAALGPLTGLAAPRGPLALVCFTTSRSMRLLFAAEKGDEAVVSALLAAGADENAALQGCCTPLLIATNCGHEAVVSALLAAGANKNAATQNGSSALHSAALNGHE